MVIARNDAVTVPRLGHVAAKDDSNILAHGQNFARRCFVRLRTGERQIQVARQDTPRLLGHTERILGIFDKLQVWENMHKRGKAPGFARVTSLADCGRCCVVNLNRAPFPSNVRCAVEANAQAQTIFARRPAKPLS